MANHDLATYLNDHLSGSVVALDLLDHLEREHAGTHIGRFAADLKVEVAADRDALEALMDRLEVARSVPRKATAWLTAKMTDLKLRLDDPGGGGLRLLEILEGLSLGIEGKHSLWRALDAASDVDPALGQADYAALRSRAEEQRDGVEILRLEAAMEAFGAGPGEAPD